ncbi:MAG: hypothetical protein GC151_07800 [Betaproteobacteria bacterium]|nr:hypothetical protein [Betaproteobacteria bacterium]
MPEDDPNGLDALAESILGYVRVHPQAADTVEGIRTWWLPARLADATPEAVLICVERLARERRLRRRVLSDGTEIYGGLP